MSLICNTHYCSLGEDLLKHMCKVINGHLNTIVSSIQTRLFRILIVIHWSNILAQQKSVSCLRHQILWRLNKHIIGHAFWSVCNVFSEIQCSSEIPIGQGLKSSSAISCAAIKALNHINHSHLYLSTRTMQCAVSYRSTLQDAEDRVNLKYLHPFGGNPCKLALPTISWSCLSRICLMKSYYITHNPPPSLFQRACVLVQEDEWSGAWGNDGIS